MIRLFKGTCEAVRAMHDYRPSPRSAALPPTNQQQRQANGTSSSANGNPVRKVSAGSRKNTVERHSEDDEDERFPQPEGDADGGYSYGDSVTVPLVTKQRVEEEGEVVFDGDEEAAEIAGAAGAGGSGGSEVVPYAHRDLKPG